MEGWPSGLRRTPGKRVEVNASPGFEYPSLRHFFPIKKIVDVYVILQFPEKDLVPICMSFSDEFCRKMKVFLLLQALMIRL